MTAFGSQSMALPLKRVIMRLPDRVMAGAEPDIWHYGPQFNPQKASQQHSVFADLVARSGAEITWIRDGNDGLADSIFTHDPSLVTNKGAILLRMGKRLREEEPELHHETYRQMDVPILGRIEAPGTVEGGDCVWVDDKTLAVGRGVRTNQTGIEQLAAILEPLGVTVLGFDLPLWHGEDACLHLMSIISPLAEKLALVHMPLLPAAFYQLLKERGIRLVAAPEDEFAASNGLNLNVLPTSPYEIIAVAGFEGTKAAMEAAGCKVSTFEADALCIACEGGPTCLTRPVWRQ
ncbi:amidinotransferase [Phyllobacterium salinisoli]|uniref:arginine deiminase n=1 Tax=Phyllobacterium salinisoli TaxID=1899321 RepID=A0A368K530_9HYPH|nr:arginine deiminase family protein [Phyllobacterium salinisoli]RCS24489.1 amidinotransferase [Phyllobacterium salinisoli]